MPRAYGKYFAGFTMIELLVVMVLFTLGASLAMYFGNSMLMKMKSKAQAREIVAYLNHCRMYSLTKHIDCSCYYNPAEKLLSTDRYDSVLRIDPEMVVYSLALEDRTPGNKDLFRLVRFRGIGGSDADAFHIRYKTIAYSFIIDKRLGDITIEEK